MWVSVRLSLGNVGEYMPVAEQCGGVYACRWAMWVTRNFGGLKNYPFSLTPIYFGAGRPQLVSPKVKE
jgi:hypothetical protein